MRVVASVFIALRRTRRSDLRLVPISAQIWFRKADSGDDTACHLIVFSAGGVKYRRRSSRQMYALARRSHR